jgi:hypothetical protein
MHQGQANGTPPTICQQTGHGLMVKLQQVCQRITSGLLPDFCQIGASLTTCLRGHEKSNATFESRMRRKVKKSILFCL